MNKKMTNIETKREELIYPYTLESAKVNLEIIKKLINDNSCIVRRQLFANLRILLLEDKNNEEIKEIKECLASSMNTHLDILEKLAKDEYYSVRNKLAKNLNTTEEILEILAKDESFMIRYEVTQNPNSNLETLEFLTKDKDKFVKHFAKISFNKFKKNSLIK